MVKSTGLSILSEVASTPCPELDPGLCLCFDPPFVPRRVALEWEDRWLLLLDTSIGDPSTVDETSGGTSECTSVSTSAASCIVVDGEMTSGGGYLSSSGGTGGSVVAGGASLISGGSISMIDASA